ncbi:glycerol-3-phosphate dehydrogenase/oxidase [Pseudobacteriovorax antillogorgiicola]|uniref:Alpha-glycerophosphate oxidase/glycerol-3-phosphate dehydrogenase n=1 Tax=Pseudobacteriovorax antillogorgiicola TaxID=1513793 RepID=A0A1Y6C2J7_9BACT|nr:glycerol-3-phosphate dehydrogenase/oxidase [Pseudobacteriovorax antillogorgiicola]TCS52318.1 alpha-glycerophosphate oxidase/glycerol-3-phosphate dehydrogenase [Pseudobacteriovorax antillogorgiicola]SMF30111.1 alpha-glycerophosphate oxidase/glycerol-3-phosphate dehydrogenase [Pseudobacteriovorax antillogorgiicola]
MSLRESNLSQLKSKIFDVLVVGGGINGSVAAAALSAKGSKVALVEKKDFASYTSQESSNLAWGGIKYMESYEFGLVWNLCASRNRLIRSFPSQVKEIRFFTTLPKKFRKPRLLVFLGSCLYWVMGRFFTKPPRLLSKRQIRKEEPIVKIDNTQGGLEYSDSYLVDNDARFVFKFVRKAMDYGCAATNYTKVQNSEYSDEDKLWHILVKDLIHNQEFVVKARSIVNATGPFVDQLNQYSHIETQHQHLFSKGVHLIVRKLSQVRHVLTFFASDGRMFFVIPMGPRSCIGTTDTRVSDLPPRVTEEDRNFILENINERLNLEQALTSDDIIAERCGVRPLVVKKKGGDQDDGDWLNLSRKHVIEVDRDRRHVSIFGGKLTDCINIGEELVDIMIDMNIDVPQAKTMWYGEPDEAVWREFQKQARLIGLDGLTSVSSSEPLSVRLWRRYGMRALELLEDIRQDIRMADLVIEEAEYIRAELHYAAKSEMITKLEDFLRRRSKIALVVSHDTIKSAPGLREACRILFEDQADERYREYFF